MSEVEQVQKRLMRIAREVNGLTWADRKCIGEAIAMLDGTVVIEPHNLDIAELIEAERRSYDECGQADRETAVDTLNRLEQRIEIANGKPMATAVERLRQSIRAVLNEPYAKDATS